MKDKNNGPWGPRRPKVQQLSAHDKSLSTKFPPFFVVGVAAITGLGVGVHIGAKLTLEDYKSQQERQQKLHPQVSVTAAKQQARAAATEQSYIDRLERCVQDDMQLNGYTISNAAFRTNAQTLAFTLTNPDESAISWVDSASRIRTDNKQDQAFDVAVHLCAAYVFTGTRNGLQQQIRAVGFKPEAML